jgi:multidrug efflux pump subunit AcrB
MRLTQLSVFHPVIAITIAMTVVIFGVFAFFNLGLDRTRSSRANHDGRG